MGLGEGPEPRVRLEELMEDGSLGKKKKLVLARRYINQKMDFLIVNLPKRFFYALWVLLKERKRREHIEEVVRIEDIFPARFIIIMDKLEREGGLGEEDQKFLVQNFNFYLFSRFFVTKLDLDEEKNQEASHGQKPPKELIWADDDRNPDTEIAPLSSFTFFYYKKNFKSWFSPNLSITLCEHDKSIYQLGSDFSFHFQPLITEEIATFEKKLINMRFLPPKVRVRDKNGKIMVEYEITEVMKTLNRILKANEANKEKIQPPSKKIFENSNFDQNDEKGWEIIATKKAQGCFCKAYKNEVVKIRFPDRTTATLYKISNKCEILTKFGDFLTIKADNPGPQLHYVQLCFEFHTEVFEPSDVKFARIIEQDQLKESIKSEMDKTGDFLRIIRGEAPRNEPRFARNEVEKRVEERNDCFSELTEHQSGYFGEGEDWNRSRWKGGGNEEELSRRLEEANQANSKILEEIESLIKK